MSSSKFDYVIVGGGIAGTVVASRLKEKLPDASIALIEVGHDCSNSPLVHDIRNAAHLAGSELDWKFQTAPQIHLKDRSVPNNAGKALGGGSNINACEIVTIPLQILRPCRLICISGGWIRGDAGDYDHWAHVVKDTRWSYRGMLPYFRKVENYHTLNVEKGEHGYEGLIHTQSVSSTGREYPLREPLRNAWKLKRSLSQLGRTSRPRS